MIHSDNKPIRMMSEADKTRLYIALMWRSRHDRRTRACIKGRIAQIRRPRSN